MSVTIPLADPLLDLFRRIMVDTFEDVVHGPRDVPQGKRQHKPGFLDSKLMAHNLIVEGPVVLNETGEYLLLRATMNGWLIRGLCGRLNLTRDNFIGWCSLAKTIFDRSYMAPQEKGTSGIYRATRDIHLTDDWTGEPVFISDDNVVAILNSHLISNLRSPYLGDDAWKEKKLYLRAHQAAHPNHHPDLWHRIGFGIHGDYHYNETPTLEALIIEDILVREYDGDKLMKDLPDRWHTWCDEDEEHIL